MFIEAPRPTPSPEPEKINGNFKGQDILSMDRFDTYSLDVLFDVTKDMREIAVNAEPCDILKGKQAVLLFYEPSSRTRGSFDAAMKQLGGQTIVVEDPQHFSSVAKGETFEDTIRTFEAYSDLIVLRHPITGSLQKAADIATRVPVINAGDGGQGEHPTQALLDLYTIKEQHGRLDNLTGVIAGDLLFGRTVKSLIRGLSLYPGNTLHLLSPDELRLPRKDFEEFVRRGVRMIEISDPKDIPSNASFWYWTRIQKERRVKNGLTVIRNLAKMFGIKQDMKNPFIVDKKLLDELGGVNTILMHPLPRVGEILEEVDEDPRAVYLKSQIRNGMYVRMALLGLVLGKIDKD
ncbi:MAG: aspartate carbamoyltransferase [Patescibacteria group bacterium]|mgnify:CR=1 FL=1